MLRMLKNANTRTMSTDSRLTVETALKICDADQLLLSAVNESFLCNGQTRVSVMSLVQAIQPHQVSSQGPAITDVILSPYARRQRLSLHWRALAVTTTVQPQYERARLSR